MLVRDVMTTTLVTVDKDRNLKDVLDLMDKHNVTKIPVVDDDALVGIVTDGMIADKLGRAHNKNVQMTTLHASSVMDKDFVVAHPDEPLANLLVDVGKPGCTMIPVVKGKQLVGIVTKADLLPLVESDTRLGDLMRSEVHAVGRTDRLVHARRLILDNQIARLPVLDDGRIIGLVAEHEIANAFAQFKQADISVQKATVRDLQVGDHMRTQVVTAHPDDSAATAAKKMIEHHVGGLPVVNGHGTIEGMVTRTDLIKTFS